MVERERRLRIMVDDNPVARINSQIFQSRDIKGCKLHFWSNAPEGALYNSLNLERGGGGAGGREGWKREALVERENRDNRFINQIKSMIE